MIAPILDDIATTYQGRLRIAKINIDDHGQTPQKFNVRSIPTLVKLVNGREVGRQSGAVPAGAIVAMVSA
jgi:thioredoxin 1